LQFGEQARSNGNGQVSGTHCRLLACSTDDLRPHPSYVGHRLSVSAVQLSPLIARGDIVFREPSTILRLPAVKAETGYSRSTIYLRISQGLWPRPVSLGPRSVGWPASEVAAINAARIAGKTDKEIGDLVARLEAARKNCLQ